MRVRDIAAPQLYVRAILHSAILGGRSAICRCEHSGCTLTVPWLENTTAEIHSCCTHWDQKDIALEAEGRALRMYIQGGMCIAAVQNPKIVDSYFWTC